MTDGRPGFLAELADLVLEDEDLRSKMGGDRQNSLIWHQTKMSWILKTTLMQTKRHVKRRVPKMLIKLLLFLLYLV